MKNKEYKKPRYRVIEFNEAYEPPENKINAKKGYIEWGKDNAYPNSSFEMYNYKGSSTNKSIINKKVKLIAGAGLAPVQNQDLNRLIRKCKLEQQIKQGVLDFEIINGMAFEVLWSRDGSRISSIKHMPIHKLREGIVDLDDPNGVHYPHYLFSNDWQSYSKRKKKEFAPEVIRAFNPEIREGKQVYVYYEYNPFCEVYPVETYSTAMNWIELDYEVSVFHINQLKQGYHPTFILNFANGIPEEEEMDSVVAEFEDKYQGARNAGKMLIAFSEGQDQAPTIETINLQDTDERFTYLKEVSKEEIATAHEIPLQIVILTPGKLASTEERLELLQEFQISYITPRQETVEYVINDILKAGGYEEEIKLLDYKEKIKDETVEEVEEEVINE